jgi:DNA-binding winged helix-turn-helix (wHTH) protein
MNELQPLAGKDHEAISLNAPTARCLQLLLQNCGKVFRDEFLAAVWETRGVVVSQNTFYQNISLLRKSLLKAGLLRISLSPSDKKASRRPGYFNPAL